MTADPANAHEDQAFLKLFEGLNYGGAALTFLAGLGVILCTTRLSADYAYLLPLVLLGYGAGQALLAIARVGMSSIPFTLKTVLPLTGLNILLSMWDLVSILIGLPFILISLILGPFMTAVLVLAAVVLGMYLVEGVLGYDIEGYRSLLENPFQAFIALVLLVIAFFVLRWHFGAEKGEDWLIDKAGDLSLNTRQRLQGLMAKIIHM
jgi:hypothetical protein